MMTATIAALQDPPKAQEWVHLTFQQYRPYLDHCDQENILVVGARDTLGIPCGLAVAVAQSSSASAATNFEDPDSKWFLCSLFVKESHRRMGVGRSLWSSLSSELGKRGCDKLSLQIVLRENTLDAVEPFLGAMGFQEIRRIAKVFSFNKEHIQESPFTKGAMANVFRAGDQFRLLTFDELSEANLAELEANEGGWYPAFVSPLLGQQKFNQRCTTFAVDPQTEKVAGWITAIDVNQDQRILYRSFFTREEYRDTPVGFFLFVEAIKNHLNYYMDRGGIASIPVDNDRAMRFTDLFFRNAVDHISFEITAAFGFLPSLSHEFDNSSI